MIHDQRRLEWLVNTCPIKKWLNLVPHGSEALLFRGAVVPYGVIQGTTGTAEQYFLTIDILG